MTASAEVAECLHTTENRIDSPSQNAIYTTVKNRNAAIRKISSASGASPVDSTPMAPTAMPMVNTMMAMTVVPARNFPTIMESR